MQKYIISFLFLSSVLLAQTTKVRSFVDTVGFAHTQKQMDVFMERVLKTESDKLNERRKAAGINSARMALNAIARTYSPNPFTVLCIPNNHMTVLARRQDPFPVRGKADGKRRCIKIRAQIFCPNRVTALRVPNNQKTRVAQRHDPLPVRRKVAGKKNF